MEQFYPIQVWSQFTVVHYWVTKQWCQIWGTIDVHSDPILKMLLKCWKRCCRPFLMFIYGKQCHFTKKSKETLEKNKIADFSLVKSAPELRNDQK